jgi:hypothetical protein
MAAVGAAVAVVAAQATSDDRRELFSWCQEVLCLRLTQGGRYASHTVQHSLGSTHP